MLLAAVALVVGTEVRVGASDLVGWAAVDAGGLASTTGGGDGPIVTVRTYEELAEHAGREAPCTIIVEGTLTGSGPVRVSSNKTIVGRGSTAVIRKFGFDLRNVSNVIIRNLTITAAMDGIAMRHVHHVWVDHCDLSACGDGLLDITQASDFVTVSWTRFSKHHKTCLVNSGTSEPSEIGKLNTTFHHCWWDGSDTRNPRAGYGKVHIFNCLYNGNEYGIGMHSLARVLAERNYFDHTNDAIFQNYEPDPASPFHGFCESRDNIFADCTGRQDADGVSFDTDRFYDYRFVLDAASDVPAIVKAGAGVGEAHGMIKPLPVPGDGAIHVSTEGSLRWTAGPDATGYRVHLGTTPSPELRTETRGRVFAPGRLKPDTVYFWRVDTITADATVPGDLWQFRTRPAVASTPTPEDGTQNTATTDALHWQAGAQAQSHKVYFGEAGSLSEIATVTDTSFCPEGLENDHTYSWRVDEVTPSGVVTGPVWSFSTQRSTRAGPGRVEAESMLLTQGYFPEANEAASGGKVAAIDGPDGAMCYRHQGPDGTYDITVAYLDESDGATPYRLYVGGQLVDQWSAGESRSADAFRTHTIRSVAIVHDAEIRLVGRRQRGELGRVDYIETSPAAPAE